MIVTAPPVETSATPSAALPKSMYALAELLTMLLDRMPLALMPAAPKKATGNEVASFVTSA